MRIPCCAPGALLDGLLDPLNTNCMLTPRIVRHRFASFLKAAQSLPPLESLPAMEPAEQAEAMTTAWDLRSRAYELSCDLDYESLKTPSNDPLTKVAQAAFELYFLLKRYDRDAVELLSLTRRPITTCAAELQSALDAMVESAPSIPLER